MFGGGGSGAGNYVTKLSALSVQTAGFGVPIKIVYGVNRVFPTLGYTDDFKANEQQNSSGKGFGGGGGSVSYSYTSTVLFFICEGPIQGHGQAWRDKEKTLTLTKAGFSTYPRGYYPQDAWSYLVSAHPDKALNYSGISYAAATNYTLSDSATVGNHSFEVFGRGLCELATGKGIVGSISGLGPWTATISNLGNSVLPHLSPGDEIVSSDHAGNGGGSIGIGGTHVIDTIAGDGLSLTYTATGGSTPIAGLVSQICKKAQNHLNAFPKDVINDFLKNTKYGAIDTQTYDLQLDTTAMQSYCVARGILISPIIDSQAEASTYIKDWALIANCGIVWSEGHLRFIPYADKSVTGEWGTYTAVTTIRNAFDDDNVTEPIKPTRKNAADCYNRIQVECVDRNNDYNKYVTPTIDDLSSISVDGVRPSQNLVLDAITLPRVAMIVGHTELLKGLYIRNTYEIQTHPAEEIDRLEPMDFITITDTGLGLDALRCRIISIEHAATGEVTITSEEAPGGIYYG